MFKIGEKVVCIKPIDNIQLNEIYTISIIQDDVCRLVELAFENSNEGYYLFRFRKLDYDFVKQVCEMIEEDNLVKVDKNEIRNSI